MRVLLLIGFVLIAASTFADEAAVEAGRAVYSQTCIACHGANGKGAIPGVADLTSPNGALSKPDAELIKSINDGYQSPGSMLAMPAKGGNPTLNGDDVRAVLAYLRATFGP